MKSRKNCLETVTQNSYLPCVKFMKPWPYGLFCAVPTWSVPVHSRGLWVSELWSCHSPRSPHTHNLCLCFCFVPQARTGIASLYHEGSGSAYDICLKLTPEVLMVQKQDVVCVGGSSHGAHVSAPGTVLCMGLPGRLLGKVTDGLRTVCPPPAI